MSQALINIEDNKKSLKITNQELKGAALDLTYLKVATSENTRRAYQSDIRSFIASGGVLPTTLRGVLTYLEQQATTLNPRTLARHLTALKQWHRYQGLADPTDHPLIKKTLRGIARVHGTPKIQAPALTLAQLAQWITYLESHATLTHVRNKALLLIGFFGAFRASELVSITVESLAWEKAGLKIQLPQSKTDPSHEGQGVAIPYLKDSKTPLCAVSALKLWLEESAITEGPVFRGMTKGEDIKETPLRANSLNPLLKRLARDANLPLADHISSHSLRRGLATEASRNGASMKSIMTQGRWKDVHTVLAYIEEGQAFEDNVVQTLFE